LFLYLLVEPLLQGSASDATLSSGWRLLLVRVAIVHLKVNLFNLHRLLLLLLLLRLAPVSLLDLPLFFDPL
jgi:multisubunit Na+/H+ antiporter MnhG subunit